ncbi:SDR family NAD(P)-dependent oxidoreductase [Pelodictyon luteolum]|uniref:Oxidoreductase, short-chain dehydrogenase/reductase family n=1 Tax=Chlorobium luteolum (strain DSM 273 / BCRC 81028 / 2530) TaxID=319225 RepID=Q3B5T0_CHLL3|nr:SDR family oxidoreductase [Pelodictyon luteolum]ABB23301.1 oxidoreductase, short-chain dehydrogenase/reductase family [Pelodictyon luteolum DSM 273]
MQKLDGRVTVITGSTKGIGNAIAHAFVREGAKVVITSSSEPNVRHALDAFPEGTALGFRCDVTSPAEVERLLEAAVERFGRIDCFINNAGISDPFQSLAESDPDLWGRVIDTNIKGTYYASRAAIRYFLQFNPNGKLINMAGSGTDPQSNTPWISAYGSTKAAIARFTRSVAAEYRHTGMSIMLLHPGLVRTAMVSPSEPTAELLKQLHTFNTVLDIFAQPPSVAARLAVKMASEWSDGRTGIYLSALGNWRKKRLLLSFPFRKMFNRIDRRTY